LCQGKVCSVGDLARWEGIDVRSCGGLIPSAFSSHDSAIALLEAGAASGVASFLEGRRKVVVAAVSADQTSFASRRGVFVGFAVRAAFGVALSHLSRLYVRLDAILSEKCRQLLVGRQIFGRPDGLRTEVDAEVRDFIIGA
jgi:hypothetical protein